MLGHLLELPCCSTTLLFVLHCFDPVVGFAAASPIVFVLMVLFVYV